MTAPLVRYPILQPGKPTPMTKPFLIAALGAAASALFVAPGPVVAQSQQNVLIVYGNDPCPTTKSGEEIVVCARKPEADRYRIPEQLRSSNPPANERWADRAKSLETVGASGAGSCSATGAGGWTGCWSKMMDKARGERKADAEGTANTGDTGIRAVVKGNQ